MPNQNKLDTIYMNIAKAISKLSYAERSKVGAIAVKNTQIIGEGYNGTPHKWDNTCEIDNKTVPEVLHAEANLITKIAKSTLSSEGSTLYVTLSPCFECAKLIYQSGFNRVVYLEEYRNTDGLEFLKKCGITVEKLQ